MRILFLSHYFPPEVNAPANRTFEHCREWVSAGNEVHVITGIPSHPRGKPFEGYRPVWYRKEELDGIQVHRVWTYIAPNRGVLRRTLNYLSFIPTSMWRALRLERFDVIVATSPQFFCAVAGWLAASLKRTSWVFELRDLWPDSIAAVGAIKRSLVLRMLEKLELHMYRKASMVVCLTKSFASNLQSRGIPDAKLAYVPNGVNCDFWQGGEGLVLREQLGLKPDDVVVSYIGTLGMAHGIDTILQSAEILRKTAPNVRFLVVGDGAELTTLRSQAVSMGLNNLTFTGLVPRDRVKDYMAATDIALVLLRGNQVFRTVLPSKMFECMGSGKPIILGVEGEARDVLELSGAGIAIPPEDSDALARAVTDLARAPERRVQMGQSGQAFVQKEFSRRVWAERYLQLLGSDWVRTSRKAKGKRLKAHLA